MPRAACDLHHLPRSLPLSESVPLGPELRSSLPATKHFEQSRICIIEWLPLQILSRFQLYHYILQDHDEEPTRDMLQVRDLATEMLTSISTCPNINFKVKKPFIGLRVASFGKYDVNTSMLATAESDSFEQMTIYSPTWYGLLPTLNFRRLTHSKVPICRIDA